MTPVRNTLYCLIHVEGIQVLLDHCLELVARAMGQLDVKCSQQAIHDLSRDNDAFPWRGKGVSSHIQVPLDIFNIVELLGWLRVLNKMGMGALTVSPARQGGW